MNKKQLMETRELFKINEENLKNALDPVIYEVLLYNNRYLHKYITKYTNKFDLSIEDPFLIPASLLRKLYKHNNKVFDLYHAMDIGVLKPLVDVDFKEADMVTLLGVTKYNHYFKIKDDNIDLFLWFIDFIVVNICHNSIMYKMIIPENTNDIYDLYRETFDDFKYTLTECKGGDAEQFLSSVNVLDSELMIYKSMLNIDFNTIGPELFKLLNIMKKYQVFITNLCGIKDADTVTKLLLVFIGSNDTLNTIAIKKTGVNFRTEDINSYNDLVISEAHISRMCKRMSYDTIISELKDIFAKKIKFIRKLNKNRGYE